MQSSHRIHHSSIIIQAMDTWKVFGAIETHVGQCRSEARMWVGLLGTGYSESQNG